MKKNFDSNVVGFVANEIYKVEKFGSTFKMIDTAGNKVGTLGTSLTRKQAFNEGKAVQAYVDKTGKKTYRKVDMGIYNAMIIPMNTADGGIQIEESADHNAVKDFIHKSSVSLKPRELVMTDLKWKYLIRSAVRAKNIMMTGPAGCGKTLAAKALVKSLERPDYYFNLGATQDPRATLIGNTHFDQGKGTFFSESAFVKAIKTPNAVILLDELSRAHPDAWNILMSVLDQGQRYLRLDEAEGSPIIKVASGVTFIATANVGGEYTATRVMDRALMDRFVQIEMDLLDKENELALLKFKFPEADEYSLNALAEIADTTRQLIKTDASKISTIVSTRVNVEAAGLIYDGFSLFEAASIAILPYFSNDGGLDSERVFMTQLLQKYIKSDDESKLFNEVKDEETTDGDETIVW